MNEITNTQSLTPINILAEQAELYSTNIAFDMINLGRVFIEAKAQVKHGEWGEWVRLHAGMSVRNAQQLMAIYERFGTRPAFVQLERSKLYKLLALPEGKEEEFLQEHDVQAMTARQVDEAVKRAREEMRGEIDEARRAQEAAEAKAEELRSRPPEIPQEVQERLKRQQAELDDAAARMKEDVQEKERLRREMTRLRRELDENETMLQESQQEMSRVQTELLNLQSQQARGDAERTPAGELTPEIFAAAVRQFIGSVARMPHMGRTFWRMDAEEKGVWAELLETVEHWAAESRRALETRSL